MTETLGQVLKTKRTDAKLKLREVSEKTGKSIRCIQHIEKDRNKPRTCLFITLCKLYGLNPKDYTKYFFNF